ncbi:MAG: PIN domain nuclease [Treponema sp.]|nr:PIN domain nuclease [Treponema sp.]
MVVVDTSVWIDYGRGTETPHTDALDYELACGNVVTGDLIQLEFLQGFRGDKDFEAAKQIMDSLIYYDMLGKDMALKCASNFRFLRKNGITIRKTADIIIGTFCLEHDFQLLHNDRTSSLLKNI